MKPMRIETERLELVVSDDNRDLKNYISHVKEADEFFFMYGQKASQELEDAMSLENPTVMYYSMYLKSIGDSITAKKQ